jgi:CRP/FNR family cyclic AMP-dependent transcriptional regulator
MALGDDDLLQRFGAGAWFAGLDPGLQRALLAPGRLQSVRQGGYLFRRGDPPSGMYGVVSGYLRASTLSQDGREAILTVLEPANWFGEASSSDGQPRSHDVTGCTDAVVLNVPHADFEALMERPGFPAAITRLFARHTRVTYALLEDAALRTTRARIVRRLLRLSRGEAALVAKERRLIPISQETLAMMVGVTRQTLALELRGLVEAGALALGYARIELVSIERLESFAE